METSPICFTARKTLRLMLVYFLLLLAGELAGSLLGSLLSQAIPFSKDWMDLSLRAVAGLVLTVLFFQGYTDTLHLRLPDFRITAALRWWAIPLSLLLPGGVALVYLAIGEPYVPSLPALDAFGMVLVSFLYALKAGITEEMLFRGIYFTLMERRWNKTAAIFVPSFLFGAVHLLSPEILSFDGRLPLLKNGLLLLVSGTLIGVMLSLAAWRGQSAVNSMPFHTAWNFFLAGYVLQILPTQPPSPEFSEQLGQALVSICIPSQALLLTGGKFGVKASGISAAGYVVACVLILLVTRKKDA